MTEAYNQRKLFDIGRVLSGAFGVVGRRLGVFIVLSLLYSVVTGLISVGLGAAVVGLRAGAPGPTAASGALSAFIVLFQLAALLGQIAFVQAMVSFATLADIRGRQPTFNACLTAGLGNMLQTALILVIRLLCEFVGYIFLIIPGVYLAVIWSLAVPAQVVEKLDIFTAFGRSNDLTRGNRWSVFGLILVVRVINSVALIGAYIIGAIALIVPLAALGAFSSGHTGANSAGVVAMGLLIGIVVMFILTVFLAVNAAITAVSYAELLPAAEGGSPRELEAVFS